MIVGLESNTRHALCWRKGHASLPLPLSVDVRPQQTLRGSREFAVYPNS